MVVPILQRLKKRQHDCLEVRYRHVLTYRKHFCGCEEISTFPTLIIVTIMNTYRKTLTYYRENQARYSGYNHADSDVPENAKVS